MGFNMKTWGNPITLDANNLNRIEQGIKNSHDTLEIVSEEVSNLQNRHADIVKDLNTLTKDAPNIIETLNKVSSLLENNDISAVLSSADNFLMKTQQTLTGAELKQVYKNLELDKFLKLTSIKVNGESVVKGSEVSITLPNIDNSLDINSNNAISNAAVVKALKNINIDVEVPTKLSELTQEVNYQTVTASEKAKWNKLEEDIKNISFTETDPTVPSWAKSPAKPIYDYVEILNTPNIPKDNVELLNGAGYITSPQATTISEDLIKKFNQSTIIPIDNKITALEAADVAILKELSNLSPIKHKHTESDITDLQNYALSLHTHTKSEITDFSHTHDYLPLSGDTMEGDINLSTNRGFSATTTSGNVYDIFRVDSANRKMTVGGTYPALELKGLNERPTYNGSDVALYSDIPTINNATLTLQLNNSSIGTFTANASSNVTANIKALPNYSITINHQTAGNPRHVKFLTVNYSNYTSNAAAYFKLGAMSCHGNGTSYQFLEDIIIGVTYNGTIKCEVYKYVQIAGEKVDEIQTYYGDVYYVHDSTNKIVDFYILCGQWASSQFTPFTKIGSTTTSGITQYTGTATYYSSGTKVWANGCSTTYARLSDVSTNYIPQGGTLTAPLTVTGGDQATAGKIILDQNNKGQITNTSTQTLLGFTNSTTLAVGHSSYLLALRGSGTRPKFNSKDMALYSDLANYFPLAGGSIGANGISWDASSLPQDTAPQFICTIDAFANGGRQKWASLTDLKTQLEIHKLGTTNWSVAQNSNGDLVFTYA